MKTRSGRRRWRQYPVAEEEDEIPSLYRKTHPLAVESKSRCSEESAINRNNYFILDFT
jgi:hypothetical protein